jgi:DNA-binding response OmpR family regulator
VKDNDPNILINHSKVILLGEDDIDDQEFLQDVFSTINTSYKLKAIGNGKNIITFLEGLSDDSLPSLIILDYNLPELNGAEILKLLKANKRYDNVPKLIWSTSGSAVFKSMCMELGASDYIVKPSTVTAFTKVAEYMLSFSN